jgi:two-component system, NtrC family, response regulator AtoC
MNNAVLIIEDNATLGKNMAAFLRQHGYDARTAADSVQAFSMMEQFRPAVALVDYSLPGMNGLDILKCLRLERPDVKAIMITGHGSVEIAVEAMKSGASDYLSKPLALSEMKLIVDKVLGQQQNEAPTIQHQLEQRSRKIEDLIGESPQMRALKEAIGRLISAEFALRDRDRPAVLVTGETGTGKELVARAIHHDGPRGSGPFLELNCAAMPATLIESELFGHERGAFTDARESKQGLVELAHEGTLFLDEIGELDLSIQSKLLRLIEEKAVRRLGGLREERAQVRIVAATNQDLERLISERKFRADLFFRLRIVHLHLPPLRDRGHDILLLARHFLQQHSERYGKHGLSFSPSGCKALLGHSWPGNVRELRNRMEHAVLMAQGPQLGAEQLALTPAAAVRGTSSDPDVPRLPEQGVVLEQFEQSLVRQALQRTHWNVTRAAKLLGLSRDTLRYRMEKFELKPPA